MQLRAEPARPRSPRAESRGARAGAGSECSSEQNPPAPVHPERSRGAREPASSRQPSSGLQRRVARRAGKRKGSRFSLLAWSPRRRAPAAVGCRAFDRRQRALASEAKLPAPARGLRKMNERSFIFLPAPSRWWEVGVGAGWAPSRPSRAARCFKRASLRNFGRCDALRAEIRGRPRWATNGRPTLSIGGRDQPPEPEAQLRAVSERVRRSCACRARAPSSDLSRGPSPRRTGPHRPAGGSRPARS